MKRKIEVKRKITEKLPIGTVKTKNDQGGGR
jgi:hypothetical protein